MIPVIHIGCSGFFNRHWKEIFYPVGTRQKDWFNYYAQHFDTLEINTTFYKFPEATRLHQWYVASPERFKFSVKVPRLITHFKKLNQCERLLIDFYNACDEGLQEKLGCILFQFPPLFTFTPDRLDLLVDSLHIGYKNVVEFRHESWWCDEAIVRLRKQNIIFCIPSHPTMPDDFLVTSGITYLRFHGVQKMFYSSYSDEDLQKVAKDLLNQAHVDEAWIYFNNTASTAGVLNALRLKEIVSTYTK